MKKAYNQTARPTRKRVGRGLVLRPFVMTSAWKSLTKNKGEAHIYRDVLVMGSIYVIKSMILLEIVDFGQTFRDLLSKWTG